MFVIERYSPVIIPVDTAVSITSDVLGGFLAKTSGTLTVTNSAGTTIINAVAVTAGAFTPMPFSLGKGPKTVTSAGGASGTLAAGS